MDTKLILKIDYLAKIYIKQMKFLKLMWSVLAILSLSSIFEDDAHYIVSKKGWEVLNKKNK